TVTAHRARSEGLWRVGLSRGAGRHRECGQRRDQAARYFHQHVAAKRVETRGSDRQGARSHGKLNDRRLPRPSGAAGPSGRDPQRCGAISERSPDRRWGSLAFAFAAGKPTRPMSKALSDIPPRLAWMSKQSIDRQVVGGWVDMFGYELPAAEAEAWSRLANNCLLSAAKSEPHFVALATVPLGDGARAASVLMAAMAAGFPGAMIGTLP